MNMREFIGIICELVGYGCVLACSLLLSDLLGRAMAAQPIIGTCRMPAGFLCAWLCADLLAREGQS